MSKPISIGIAQEKQKEREDRKQKMYQDPLSESVKKISKIIDNIEDPEPVYVPNQYDPESVSTKTYLWDLNNQVFELNQNIKTLTMCVNEICAELSKNSNTKRDLPVIGIRQ